eukprot:TRINITY_DN2344_c0_g5_i1.p1 TRINITY_DN2344_c0_g5~~TRINITY_DN2344_c0_g5_i1.p1  ORF type:complete len:747 (+),score=206.60 TRINITY_DN2344_c0_g5_i1:108-2243(+)
MALSTQFDAESATSVSPSASARGEHPAASAVSVSGNEAEAVPASVRARACEVIPSRFYFLSLRGHPQSDDKNFFWTVDHDLVYEPFMADFGPLNLSMLVKFCRAADRNLRDPELAGRRIYLYSSHDGHKRANAGYLAASFLVLVLGRTPEQAWAPFAASYPPFLPFRDALCGVSTYNHTIPHCLEGLYRARQLGWIDWRSFNCAEYDHFELPQNGDWNWIVPPSIDGTPGKFIAFSAPREDIDESMYGFQPLGVAEYREEFARRGVTGIVRLCFATYDRRKFTEYRFRHLDFARASDGSEIFPDGSAPTDAILQQFMDFAESNPGAVAVHCKAGLGRTGTLIGAYLIKHYGFSAPAAIAWMRICRPGSVLGPQQHYLCEAEPRIRRRLRRICHQHAAAEAAPAPLQPSPVKRSRGAPQPQREEARSVPLPQRPPVRRPPTGKVPRHPRAEDGDVRTQALLARSRQMQQEIAALIELQRRGAPLPDSALAGPAADSVTADSASGGSPGMSAWEAAVNELHSAAEEMDPATAAQLAAMVTPGPLVQRAAVALLALLGERPTGGSWDAARRIIGAPGLGERLVQACTPSAILSLPAGQLRRVAAFGDPACSKAMARAGQGEALFRLLRAAAAVAARCPQLRVSASDSAVAAAGKRELSVPVSRLRGRLPRPSGGSLIFTEAQRADAAPAQRAASAAAALVGALPAVQARPVVSA